jgi:hypothetical protein
MHGNNILILVAVIVGVDALIIPLIVGAVVDANWNPIAQKYPPVGPSPDAVRRNFQSFAIGSLSLGWCIHVAADERCLHLNPCWIARCIRARPASIPWQKLALESAIGKHAVAILPELPSIRVRGPRWCLELSPAL